MYRREFVVAAVIFSGFPCSSFGSIYFGTNSSGLVRNVQLDGTNVATVLDPPTGGTATNVRALAADSGGGRIYFGIESFAFTGIASANFDGSGYQQLLDSFPADMEVDAVGGHIFFSRGNGSLYRMGLDGSGVTAIDFGFGGTTDLVGLAIDHAQGKLYFTESVGGAIYRSNLDGGGLELVVQFSGPTNIVDLEVDATRGELYWLNDSQHKLQRSDVNGSAVEDLVDSVLGRRMLLDTDSQTVYWSSPGGYSQPNEPGGIYKVGYDGAGPFLVLASEEDIHGLDFGPDAIIPPSVVPEPGSLLVWSLLALATGCSVWRKTTAPRPLPRPSPSRQLVGWR